jgi:hypothetical protein
MHKSEFEFYTKPPLGECLPEQSWEVLITLTAQIDRMVSMNQKAKKTVGTEATTHLLINADYLTRNATASVFQSITIKICRNLECQSLNYIL